MKRGIELLEQYGLTLYNDSIVQICNYGALLIDTGHEDIALTILNRLLKKLEIYLDKNSGDYARVNEAVGYAYLAVGNVKDATEHFKIAVDIYSTIWEVEQELLENKLTEIRVAYQSTGYYDLK